MQPNPPHTGLSVKAYFDPKNLVIPASLLTSVMTAKDIHCCLRIISIFYNSNTTATGLYHDVAMYNPQPCLPGFTSMSDFHHKIVDVLRVYRMVVKIERRRRRRAKRATHLVTPEKIPPHPFWIACAAIRKIMLRHKGGGGYVANQFMLPKETKNWFYGVGLPGSGKRRDDQIVVWKDSGIPIGDVYEMIVPSAVVEDFLYRVSVIEMIRTHQDSREFDQQQFVLTILKMQYTKDFKDSFRQTHPDLLKQHGDTKDDLVDKTTKRIIEIIVNTTLAGITMYEQAGKLPGGGVRFRHKCAVIAEDQEKKEVRREHSTGKKRGRSRSGKGNNKGKAAFGNSKKSKTKTQPKKPKTTKGKGKRKAKASTATVNAEKKAKHVQEVLNNSKNI
jgi:hypothetical protein